MLTNMSISSDIWQRCYEYLSVRFRMKYSIGYSQFLMPDLRTFVKASSSARCYQAPSHEIWQRRIETTAKDLTMSQKSMIGR